MIQQLDSNGEGLSNASGMVSGKGLAIAHAALAGPRVN
jgi:hypothetical protein